MSLGEALATMWERWMIDLAHLSLGGAALGLGLVLWVGTMTALAIYAIRQATK